MKIDKKQVLRIVYVIVAIILAYFFIKWWNRDIVAIKTAVITKGPIESVVSASGFVDAPVYDLGPKMGGKIVSLYVKEGSRVFTGMTLAEFDDTTRLVAPNNGIVAKINFLEGETVPPSATAITIVNYDRSWVEAQIDEIDIGNVKMGDKVKITTDVYPDKVFEGEIYWIAPLAELRKVGGRIKMDEESYVFPCKVRFLGGHKDLKVNMSVNVDIVTKTNKDALVVPREAIISRDDSTYVFSIKRDRAYESKISVGIRSFGSIEAESGLMPGDIIAITNVSKLKNKGRVKIER